MTDIERAIIQYDGNNEYPYPDLVVNALRKQIPFRQKITYPYGKSNEPEYECQACGNPYVNDLYCSCCGQKQDYLHDPIE